MVSKKSRIIQNLVFVILIIFPFGQLLNLEPLPGIRIHLIDLLCLFFLFINLELIKKHWMIVVGITYGSFIFFKAFDYGFFIGALYLLRALSYFTFAITLKNLIKEKKLQKKLLINSLFVISLFVAIFGWFQYFYLPDVRWLKPFGWDDHLYRIVGTFFDPGFMGIILTLGFLLSLFYFLKYNSNKFLFYSFILLVTVAFTYSRASFLSLVVSLIFAGFLTKNIKKTIGILFLFVLMIFLLPRPSSEGVKLERIYSIDSRIENYKTTYQIFIKNPLFGVGFNNLCFYKTDTLKIENLGSHSCSGSDSSILYLLSTTGVIGTLLIIKIIKDFSSKLNFSNQNTQIFMTGLLAVVVHSQFTNSLFYPWVMAWMAVLYSLLEAKLKN